MTRLETLSAMVEDAKTVKGGSITFSAGGHRLSVKYEQGIVRYTIDGWPCSEDDARRTLAALQTGWPVRLP
jgi:hypothetical protein